MDLREKKTEKNVHYSKRGMLFEKLKNLKFNFGVDSSRSETLSIITNQIHYDAIFNQSGCFLTKEKIHYLFDLKYQSTSFGVEFKFDSYLRVLLTTIWLVPIPSNHSLRPF